MHSTSPKPSCDDDNIATITRSILSDILGLSENTVNDFTMDTPLFGALPEFNSMAVANVLTEMEDRLDILIDDDEIDGEIFENFGNLSAFVQRKCAA